MSTLCQYKNVFGKEREGVHAVRIFDVAIVDVVLTFIAAYLIHIISGWNLILVTILLFILGIIAHRLFCVNTKVNVLIFGEV